MNAIGLESGNNNITAGRDLPWLQDVGGEDVWNTWGVGYRDVWVLDENNVLYGIYNLTANDLGQPANFEAMRAMFYEAAGLPVP